jgi:Rrf2 family protein
MIKINKDIEYALISLVNISTKQEVASARELAEDNNIPIDLLKKILHKLSVANIIISQPGPAGGYRMLKQLDEISIHSIMEALHGTSSIVACIDDNSCNVKEDCNISHGMLKLQNKITNFLKDMTLQDFYQDKSLFTTEN